MPKITVLTASIRPEFLNITQECLERQTFKDFEWLVEIGLRNKGFKLPNDNNIMLRRAKGERIVHINDCIKVPDNFLEYINSLPNEFYTFPIGKVMEFGQEPSWDWRATYDGELPGPEYWEADSACGPTKAYFEVGGFDEDFGNGWAWDNVEFAYRAAAAGYKFYCDSSLKSDVLDHDKLRENPFRHTLELNDKRAMETKRRASIGQYKLHFLD